MSVPEVTRDGWQHGQTRTASAQAPGLQFRGLGPLGAAGDHVSAVKSLVNINEIAVMHRNFT
jgi:hypothetical protein